MIHYAGVDVSLETSSNCVVGGSGKVLRELEAESEPEALAAALTGVRLEFGRIGLEAGPMSQWLHAGLRAAGLSVVPLETRQLRAATRTMPVKTDRTDARVAIAQMVRISWFRALHMKSELSQELRALLTARKLLVSKLRDIDNGIRGLLRGFGLKVGTFGERAFPSCARELAAGRKSLAAVIEPLLQLREVLLTERERLHRLVLLATRDDAVCRRLMTVPGVGPVTALTFCSAVDDPSRFSHSRAVGAHSGLTPRRYQSGETDRAGHISKQGDTMVTTPTLCIQPATHVPGAAAVRTGARLRSSATSRMSRPWPRIAASMTAFEAITSPSGKLPAAPASHAAATAAFSPHMRGSYRAMRSESSR
jgi:transposase